VAVWIRCARGRSPEREYLIVAEGPLAVVLRTNDGFWLQAIGRRHLDAIDVLIDGPRKKPLRISKQIVRLVGRSAILSGLHDGTHVMRRDICDRTTAPRGKELAPNIALDLGTLAFRRKLFRNEVLGDGAEGVSPLALFCEPLALFFGLRVKAPLDRRACAIPWPSPAPLRGTSRDIRRAPERPHSPAPDIGCAE